MVEGFGVVPSFTALFVLIRADYSDRTHHIYSFYTSLILILFLFLPYSILFFIFSFSILHSF